jgi:hypothetical protein
VEGLEKERRTVTKKPVILAVFLVANFCRNYYI